MAGYDVVIDTNALIAALRSSGGSSYQVLRRVGEHPGFRIHLSVPLVFEYEEVALRHSGEVELQAEDVDTVLDYLCSAAQLHDIFFLWRPVLPDPRDDMVLELAVAGGCQGIVTYNQRDFAGAEKFGLWVETPSDFLRRIGESQ